MDMTHKHALAMALVLISLSTGTGQERESVTDPEAYVLWGLLVPPYWSTDQQVNSGQKTPILLQRETQRSLNGCDGPKAPDRAWQSAVDSFHRQNKRVQILQPLLKTDPRYRLIPRAEIEADDARLAIKYPGSWQRLPESMEYVAVSAIGFNGDKSKAILYMRLRGTGGIFFMERRDGKWAHASTLSRCRWVA